MNTIIVHHNDPGGYSSKYKAEGREFFNNIMSFDIDLETINILKQVNKRIGIWHNPDGQILITSPRAKGTIIIQLKDNVSDYYVTSLDTKLFKEEMTKAYETDLKNILDSITKYLDKKKAPK